MVKFKRFLKRWIWIPILFIALSIAFSAFLLTRKNKLIEKLVKGLEQKIFTLSNEVKQNEEILNNSADKFNDLTSGKFGK